jgi:hypothetical protein
MNIYNCILFVILDKICIGYISTICVYAPVRMSYICHYSIKKKGYNVLTNSVGLQNY